MRVSRREAAALLLACLAMPAAAQATSDYSEVTSRESAEQLVAEGRLVRILLFPIELGGSDVPENVSYVPPAIAEVRGQVIETIGSQIEAGLIDRMTVTPEYRGASVVPVRIDFRASHSTRGGSFAPSINVW